MHARSQVIKHNRYAHTAALWLMVACLGGCQSASLPNARGRVSQDITQRFGQGITTPLRSDQTMIPPDVILDDGLTEQEASRVALWNNAAFQALLADLGISNAQLFNAGLISDPRFSIFFPLGPKQLEFAAFQSVDALWLRPIRIRAAKLDLNQVSQSMVQNGLNTIRDARVAHADLVQAQQQAEVARNAESIRSQIAELARKRLAAGDISELEATTSQIDALQAQAAAGRARQDVRLAQHRLRTILGMTMLETPLVAIDNGKTGGTINQDAESLVRMALVMRPDLRAAEIGIEAACQRAGVAKGQFMTMEAIYDANGKGLQGFESGPGLLLSLPIFNRNRGNIAIANAQWQRAARQYVTVRDQVTLDVRMARTQLKQARENLDLLQTEILPSLQEAQRLAQRNYEDGGTTYFLVLQTTGSYLDSRTREYLLMADVRRATAELERSVGMRLETSAPAAVLDQAMLESSL